MKKDTHLNTFRLLISHYKISLLGLLTCAVVCSCVQKPRTERNTLSATKSVMFFFKAPIGVQKFRAARTLAYEEARTRQIEFNDVPSLRAELVQMSTAMATKTAVLLPRLPTDCQQTIEWSRYVPFGFCKVSDLAGLRAVDDVKMVVEVPDSSPLIKTSTPWCPAVNYANATSNSIDDIAENLRTDCANSEGFYAEDFKVGQLENYYQPFHLNDYWSLGYVAQVSGYPTNLGSFTHTNNGMSCGNGSDKSEHATGVAGVVGSEARDCTRHHAANSEIYFGNDMFDANVVAPFNTECGSFAKHITTLEWLTIENGVRLVNESYRCQGTAKVRAFLTDYFARYFDVAFVRASGNLGEGSIYSHCYASNTICVGSHDMGGNGNSNPGFNFQHGVSSFSKYRDPQMEYGGAASNNKKTDREEPDVLAAGELIQTLWGEDGPICDTCDDAFTGFVSGTSYSAPGITGLVALAGEQIGNGYESCRFSEWARGLVKSASIDHTEFMYGAGSPPPRTSRLARHGVDWNNLLAEDERHGAGSPEFHRMLGWVCSDADDAWVTPDDQDEIDWSGLATLDRTHPHPTIDDDHPSTNGVSQTEFGFEIDPNDHLQDPLIYDDPTLDCGIEPQTSETRLVRVVLEWSSCPGEIGDYLTEISRPATDFNLALRDPNGAEYWMSTSFDDNSESFEYCAESRGSLFEPGYKIGVIPTVAEWGCAEDPDDAGSKRGEFKYLFIDSIPVDDPEAECPTLEDFGHGL